MIVQYYTKKNNIDFLIALNSRKRNYILNKNKRYFRKMPLVFI